MKCKRCQAMNVRGTLTCWACGVRLGRSWRDRRSLYRPEAMRHYRSAAVAIDSHRAWLDGLVLLSTILFGVLLAYFLIDVLPRSRTGAAVTVAAPASPISRISRLNPISMFFPSLEVRAAVPTGQAQEVKGVVAQAAGPRRSKSEGGQAASAGSEFLVATMVVDNQSKQSFSYNLTDFQVRDSKARVHTAENIRGAGWLSSGTIEPGQRVQGTVAFLIPEGDAQPQLTFTSNPLRTILRWDVTPAQ